MSTEATAQARAVRLRWWEIAGGIVLPLLAAAGQILLLREDTVGPWLTWGYVLFGIGALLGAAKTCTNPAWRGFICGANFGCAAGYLVDAFDHQRHSYFFVWPAALVLICLPAILAAPVNIGRGGTLLGGGLRWSAVVLGAVAAFAPPVAAQFAEARWVAAVNRNLRAEDINAVAAGLHALNGYPLRMGRFGVDVCQWVVIDRTDVWSGNAELTAELGKLLGPDFWHCEPRDPHG